MTRDRADELTNIDASRAQRAAITEVYRSTGYDPANVTGVYVRCSGRRGFYVFRVFETVNGTSGRFKGKPGMGPTIREYDCDGSELPADFRQRCIASKQTEKWK